jgi:hypothetical protein
MLAAGKDPAPSSRALMAAVISPASRRQGMQRGDLETGVWSRPIGNSFRLPEQVLLRSYAGTEKCPPGLAGASVCLVGQSAASTTCGRAAGGADRIRSRRDCCVVAAGGGPCRAGLVAAHRGHFNLSTRLTAIAGAAVLLQWKISVRGSPAAPRPSPAIAAVSAGRHGGRPGGNPQPEPELPASAEAGTWRRLIAPVSGRGTGRAGSKARNTGGRMRARPAATSRRRCWPPSGRPRPAPWSASRWTAPRP